MNFDDLFSNEPGDRPPRRPLPWVWIVGGLCAALMVPAMISTLPQTIAESNRTKAEMGKVSRIQADTLAQGELARIAEERYANGCIFVFTQADPTLPQVLTEGWPVRDRNSGAWLPAGMTVCDTSGNTGLLRAMDTDGDGIPTPAVADLAFTGNRQAIDAAMRKAGIAQ